MFVVVASVVASVVGSVVASVVVSIMVASVVVSVVACRGGVCHAGVVFLVVSSSSGGSYHY